MRPPALVAASLSALVLCGAAGAPSAAATARVTLAPAGGTPGTSITLTGAGFDRSQVVRVVLRDRVRSVRASALGRFTARLTVPARSAGLAVRDGRRVVRALVSARAGAAQESEAADEHGVRVRFARSVPAGGRLVLRARGLRSAARVQPRGAPLSILAPRGGLLVESIALPDRAGPTAVVLRSGRTRLVLDVTILPRALVAPAPEPVAPTVVAAAGDIACDPTESNFNNANGTARACRHRAVAQVVQDLAPEYLLTIGDHQYTQGRMDQFRASYDLWWGVLKPITRPVPGNHDYGTADARDYFDYFNGEGVATGPAGRRLEGWHSFDAGPWHIVGLNSNCAKVAGGCGPDSPQAAWLRADLAASGARCTLAYFHHPLFTSGRNPATPEMRPLWQILYDAGADLVLNGHDHNYERFAHQDPQGAPDPERGIREIIVGTGGRSLRLPGPTTAAQSEYYHHDTFGVLVLELYPTSYRWRFAGERPEAVSEAGEESCH